MFWVILVIISFICPSSVALICFCDTDPLHGMKDIADELHNVYHMPKCESGTCVAALPVESADDGYEPACTKFANETDFYHACYMV